MWYEGTIIITIIATIVTKSIKRNTVQIGEVDGSNPMVSVIIKGMETKKTKTKRGLGALNLHSSSLNRLLVSKTA
jgi:hypothetical protein